MTKQFDEAEIKVLDNGMHNEYTFNKEAITKTRDYFSYNMNTLDKDIIIDDPYLKKIDDIWKEENQMVALREIVNRETLKNFEVPEEFGNEFEMILVPINNIEKNSDESNTLMQYQEENGFSKNILTQTSEDVWNDL